MEKVKAKDDHSLNSVLFVCRVMGMFIPASGVQYPRRCRTAMEVRSQIVCRVQDILQKYFICALICDPACGVQAAAGVYLGYKTKCTLTENIPVSYTHLDVYKRQVLYII